MGGAGCMREGSGKRGGMRVEGGERNNEVGGCVEQVVRGREVGRGEE